MVITGGAIADYRAENIKRSIVADLLFAVHIHFDLIKRHVSGAFDHDLHTGFAAPENQFSEGVEFGELSFIGSIGKASGAQTVSE